MMLLFAIGMLAVTPESDEMGASPAASYVPLPQSHESAKALPPRGLRAFEANEKAAICGGFREKLRD